MHFSKNTCIPVGAYTTANARLMLFKELIQLENEILYCDTDSIIYIERKNSTYKPDIGTSIGQLTDEIIEYGQDAYISEYVCVRPKAYSLKITVPSKNEVIEVCKCKGFRLNKQNSKLLHFESYKDLVFGDSGSGHVDDKDESMQDNSCITTTDTKIMRKKISL